MATRNGILDGALDLHVHSAPDRAARCVDDIGLARAAAEVGAAGALIKSHDEPTAGRAWHAQHSVPQIAMFGGLVLNRAAGGLNAAAVDAFARSGGGSGRIVWLPTRDAEHEIATKGRTNATVPVTEAGKPVAAFGPVAEAVARADLVLATGHVAPQEALILLAEARALGCRKLLVTHVTAPVSDYTLPQLDRAAEIGAVFELSARNFFSRENGEMRLDLGKRDRAADVLRRFGPNRVILSSDLGDPAYPGPFDGLAAAATALVEAGIAERDVRAIVADTPRALVRAVADQATE